MRSYVAVVGPGVDAQQIATMTAAMRLPSSSKAEIAVSSSVAAFAVVAHRAEDSLPRLIRDGSTIVTGDVRLDARNALEKALGVTAPDDLRLLFHAWQRWGGQTAEHIIGDYSAVIWDERTQRLCCIRDRFGVRPLYYARPGAQFVVSDVLECVLAHPEVDAESLDAQAVAGYLADGMISDPSATVFAAIRRLPPRCVLTRTGDGKLATREYWTPTARAALHDPVAELRGALDAAIRDRTKGGHAVVFMSGGLDSTALAVTANEAQPGSVTAITSVYRSRIADDEESFATEAARSIGIPIEVFPLDSFDPLGAIRSGMWMADPGPLLYAEPTRAVYAASAAIAPVALHGHPADALFLGDPQHALQSLLREGRVLALIRALFAVTRARQRPPWFFLRKPFGRARPDAGTGSTLPGWFDESFRREVERKTAIRSGRHTPLDALLSPIWPSYFEWAHPVATRAPIALVYPWCDPRVVEVALALDEIPWRVEKSVLRELLRGRVAERVRMRRKQWLQGNPWQAPAPDASQIRIEAAAGFIDGELLAATIVEDGTVADGTLRALVFEWWLQELPGRTRRLRMA